MRAAATDGIEGIAGYRRKPRPSWAEDLIRNDKGTPKALLANAITAFRYAPEWSGRLSYDAMSLTTFAAAPPPWEAGANQWQERPWSPRDDVLATDWLQHNGIGVGVEVTQAAIEAVAQDNAFHPVRDYLEGLRWDGEERADRLFTDYFGAIPTEETAAYIKAVGSRFLISAVARVMKPGVKVDTMPVLEGPQGIGKSTAVKVLAEPWFTDEIADLGSKDASLQVQGIWIAELSELDAMSRGEVAKVKAFLSRTTDRFRPPYGRRVIEVPRQAVFIGTTNVDGYLKDETGGRRFWPVRVGSIDLARLRRDRDQLWAEAFHRYVAGEPWWLDTKDLVGKAAEEQADRYVGDPWLTAVVAALSQKKSATVSEVLGEEGLGIDKGRWGQIEQNRVSRIFTTLGWKRKQVREGRNREWRYFRPETGDIEECHQ